MGKGEYDHTVIFSVEPFAASNRKPYDVVVSGNAALASRVISKGKAVTHATSLDQTVVIENALSSCTDKTRLYIGGHGNATHFAKRTPEKLVETLYLYKLRAAKRIILLGCNSASGDDVTKSYAGNFHRILGGEPYNIRCEVTGYSHSIAKYNPTAEALNQIRKERGPQAEAYHRSLIAKTIIRTEDGLKLLRDPKDGYQGFLSKWFITWDGEKQKVDFE